MTSLSFQQPNVGAAFYKPSNPVVDWDEPINTGLALDLAISETDRETGVIRDNSRVTGDGAITSGANPPTWETDPDFGTYLNFPGPPDPGGADNGSIDLVPFRQVPTSFPFQAGYPWTAQFILRIVPDAVDRINIFTSSLGFPIDMAIRHTTAFGGGSALSILARDVGESVDWFFSPFFDSEWINMIVRWEPTETVEARVWKNGVEIIPFGGPSTMTGGTHAIDECLVGFNPDTANPSNMVGDLALCRIWSRSMAVDEIESLSADPWQIYVADDDIIHPSLFSAVNPSGVRITPFQAGVRRR